MITLSLLKQLETAGLGEIDTNLFWGKLPLEQTGIAIIDIGGDRERELRPSTVFELYSRGDNDVDGFRQLEGVVAYLQSLYTICMLPAVPPVSNKEYHGVSVVISSQIVNSGEDINGRIIWSVTGRIYYGRARDIPENGAYMTTETGKVLVTENNLIIEEQYGNSED